MAIATDSERLQQFARKIGYEIGGDMPKNVDLHYQRGFDAMPELAMFIASYTVMKSFSRPTRAPAAIEDCICFYFKNIVGTEQLVKEPRRTGTRPAPPGVHIFPATQSFVSRFRKGDQVHIVTLFVNAGYLKGFLRSDVGRFPFLFDRRSDFLIEEILTDDMLRTLREILDMEQRGPLIEFRMKLKLMELLLHLFTGLGKREQSDHQELSERDIAAIYGVRDRLIRSLSEPAGIAELKQLAAMNELRMRRIFTQVFGKGIYEYYQHIRMLEAARLLRGAGMSVSAAGYQLGFENLSHFSRVFERHIGMKPKKYSMLMHSGQASGDSIDTAG